MANRERQARRAVKEVAMLVGRTGLTQADYPRLPEALRKAVCWRSLSFMLEVGGQGVNGLVIGECRKIKRALVARLNEQEA